MAEAKKQAIRLKDIRDGVSPSQLVNHLVRCVLAKPVPVPVIVKSPPGCGKSMIVRQVAAQLNRKLRETRTYYFNPVDWRGAPCADLKAGVTRYLPPDFLPMEDNDPTVWFFDECNVAPSAVQAVMYEVILERTVCGKKIGNQVAFIAAGNRAEDRALVHEMSSALRSRFVHLTLRPSVKDWVKWAFEAGIDPSVISFINSMGEDYLFFFEPSTHNDSFPCPRTWEVASRLIQSGVPTDSNGLPLLTGAVGAGGAAVFVEHCQVFKGLPSTDDILIGGDLKVKPPGSDRPDRLFAFCAMLSSSAAKAGDFAKVSGDPAADALSRLTKEREVGRRLIKYVDQFEDKEFAVLAYKQFTLSPAYKRIRDDFILSPEFREFSGKNKSLLGVG